MRPALPVIVVTGRMVQSVRRALEPAGRRRAGDRLPGRRRRRRARALAAARADPARARARAIAVARAKRATRRTSTSTTSCTSRTTRREARAYAEFRTGSTSTSSARSSTGSTSRRRSSSCVGEPAVLDALEPRMKARFGDRAHIAKSLPHFLEFARAGVTKGAGMDFLAAHLGLHEGRDDRVRRRRERRRARRVARLRDRGRERARAREGRWRDGSARRPRTRAWRRCSKRF